MVQLSGDSTWYPVCNSYTVQGGAVWYWDHQEAWVTCRDHGYHGGRKSVYSGVPSTGLKVYNVSCGDGKSYHNVLIPKSTSKIKTSRDVPLLSTIRLTLNFKYFNVYCILMKM